MVPLIICGACGQEATDRSQTKGQTPDHRYNVVLIVSDALRYDLPGCNGGPARTPNIDALAAGGVRFTRARAAAPWTMPSAVAMLTGRQASVFPTDKPGSIPGRANFEVPRTFRTLPQVLQRGGYTLALSAYNPNAWLAGNFAGFKRVEPRANLGSFVSIPKDSLDLISGLIPFDGRSPSHRWLYGFLEFLHTTPKAQPFFAVNWFDDPHAPYNPEARFKKTVPVPDHGLQRPLYYYSRQSNLHIFDHFKEESLTPEEIAYLRGLYRAEVESVDERVGLILGMLDQRGLRANTIVIFTADHGESFNDHGMFEHGRSYYEELLHVPLIISGPGVPAGAVVDTPVSLVDLMPTLQGLLGVAGPDSGDGGGFLAALRGRPGTAGPFYFDSATDLAGSDCLDAVWDRGFKLITHRDPGAVELYDLAADPGELHDLAADHQGRVEDMTALLEGFRRRSAEQRTLLAGGQGAAPADSASPAQREEILKKLKSLGYVN